MPAITTREGEKAARQLLIGLATCANVDPTGGLARVLADEWQPGTFAAVDGIRVTSVDLAIAAVQIIRGVIGDLADVADLDPATLTARLGARVADGWPHRT